MNNKGICSETESRAAQIMHVVMSLLFLDALQTIPKYGSVFNPLQKENSIFLSSSSVIGNMDYLIDQ